MKCDKCGKKMKSQGTVDENWRFYKCSCGHEGAKHIHPKYTKTDYGFPPDASQRFM